MISISEPHLEKPAKLKLESLNMLHFCSCLFLEFRSSINAHIYESQHAKGPGFKSQAEQNEAWLLNSGSLLIENIVSPTFFALWKTIYGNLIILIKQIDV